MAATLPLEGMAMAQPATAQVLTGVVLAVVCAAVVAWWWRAVEWPVEVVEIDGRLAHTERAELKSIIARHTEAGFAAMDLGRLQRELVALPWVRTAALRRIWPDRLHVTVQEHVPAAVFNDSALLSRQGTVFRPEAIPAQGLPRLRGPEGEGHAMLRRLRRFGQALAAIDLQIAALEQDARRAWRMELANGIDLRLGRNEVVARMQRFRAVWPKKLAGRAEGIEAVDLRYTNGFAVVWRDGAGPGAREGGT